MSGKKQPKDPSPTDPLADWTPAVVVDKVLPPFEVGVSAARPSAWWRMSPAEEAELHYRPGTGRKYQYFEKFKPGKRLLGYVLEATWGERMANVGKALSTERSSDRNSVSRRQSAWTSDLPRLRLFHEARPQVYWERYPWERITLHGAEQVKRLGDLYEFVSYLKVFRRIAAAGRPPLMSQDTRTLRELVKLGNELKTRNPNYSWGLVLTKLQEFKEPGAHISRATFARYRKRFSAT